MEDNLITPIKKQQERHNDSIDRLNTIVIGDKEAKIKGLVEMWADQQKFQLLVLRVVTVVCALCFVFTASVTGFKGKFFMDLLGNLSK